MLRLLGVSRRYIRGGEGVNVFAFRVTPEVLSKAMLFSISSVESGLPGALRE